MQIQPDKGQEMVNLSLEKKHVVGLSLQHKCKLIL